MDIGTLQVKTKRSFNLIHKLVFCSFLSISSLYAADPIPDTCGYFANVLQTRNDPSKITMVNSGDIAYIKNSDSCILNTGSVYKDDYNHGLQCENGDFASGSGIYGKSLDINYDHSFVPTSVSNLPSDSSTDEDIHGEETLVQDEYKTVAFKYDGHSVTFKQQSSWLNSPSTLKVNTIKSAWNVLFKDNVAIEIGEISSATYNSPFTLKNETVVPEIKINTLNYREGSTIDLKATDSIEIESFTVGRNNSDVQLKAKNITINKLTVSNKGSDQAHITIIGDNINIGTLDMGQGATVTILPYTLGETVTLTSNTIKASSSSSLILASGDYYMNTFDIPGTSDASSVRASDENQIVNLYINGDFKPGNNPGINSTGNNGNFSSRPAKNFRLFINGDLETGGGGTTIQATTYVEGKAKLGSPTYIKGIVSTNGDIKVGNRTQLTYSGNDNSEAYFSCPIEGSADLCYDSITTEGFSISGVRMFYGVTTPIRNISDESISDATIIKSFDGIDMSMMSKIKIDNVEKTTQKDEDEAEINQNLQASFGFFNAGGIFDKGIVYRIADFSNSSTHTVYDYSTISYNSSDVKLTTVYTKNGIRYYSTIAACGGSTTRYETGPFDAWDTFRDNSATPPTDRNISTKIVNKAFNLSLASLNITNTSYQKKRINDNDITVAIYAKGSSAPISNSVNFKANSTTGDLEGAHYHVSSDLTVSKAVKDAVVGFKFCATFDGATYRLYQNSQCSSSTEIHDCNATTDRLNPTLHLCYSTDNFAIRPYAFLLFGKKEYSNAGKEFNITIKTVDENNFNKTDNSGDSYTTVEGTNNYNISLEDLTISSNFYYPTDDEINIMYDHMEDKNNSATADEKRARVTTCPSAGEFTQVNENENFSDGEIEATFKYSETGILSLAVNETIGSEFALVDKDDTDDSERLILGSTVIHDTSDINKTNLLLFNPYSLYALAQYNTTNNKSWIYMDNIKDSGNKPVMSVYLKYFVTAKNKDGSPTQNFHYQCFPDVSSDCPKVNGLKLNTTFDFRLDANITSTSDVNITIYNSDMDHNPLYISNTDKKIALTTGRELRAINVTMYPKQFREGNATSNIHFNIDRNVSISLNPVVLTVNQVYPRMEWVSEANPITQGTLLDQNKTFYYGRTHAPRQSFVGNEGNAIIYYEAYCSGSDCNKSLLPDGTNSKYSDDPRWFINTQHTPVSDGNISSIAQKNSASLVTSASPDGSNPDKVRLTYDESAGYPYKTTMEMNASKWLIYNKYNPNAVVNEFEVEFIKNSDGWAGKRETNTTTDNNAADQTNRRLMW